MDVSANFGMTLCLGLAAVFIVMGYVVVVPDLVVMVSKNVLVSCKRETVISWSCT